MTKSLRLSLMLWLGLLCLATAGSEDQADKWVREGSFQKALDLYRKITPTDAAHERLLSYKIANTQWRSQVSSENVDDTLIQGAMKMLSEIAGKEPHDLIWANANESLGDLYWHPKRGRQWNLAWPFYHNALDYWAGQSDLDTARERYLEIIRTATADRDEYYGYYGNYIPIDVLESGVKIARSPEDQARMHYLLAMALRYQGGDPRQMTRIPKEFQEALKLTNKSEWYDDALFQYAQFLEQQGKMTFEAGLPQWKPDAVEALKLYKRLTSEFKKGETRYYDQAAERIKQISSPDLQVFVQYFFLPGSDLQAQISWRNVSSISFAILPVQLVDQFPTLDDEWNDEKFLEKLEATGDKAIKKWTKEIEDDGRHTQCTEALKIESLPAGAYVLTASGGGVKKRTLLLVTSAVVTVKTTPTQLLFFVCDALSGKPLPNARVKVSYHYYDQKAQKNRWETSAGTTDEKGFWVVRQPRAGYNQVVVTATAEKQQAFVQNYASYQSYPQSEPFRVYAFTDRPAYRPDEKVEWKAVVRGYDGKTYSTPKGQWIHYEIRDPLGNKIKEDNKQLDDFGCSNDELTLDGKAPLGEYQATFYTWNADGKCTDRHIGSATLFRLEEYKLPEFKVEVSTKEKAYRMGDKVTVELAADYYFGGAVAKAKVEYLVYQAPFYHFYYPRCDYPWYYAGRYPYYNYGKGSIVERGQAETDADGKARFSFQTPFGTNQDFQYTIEARVVDSSRREIVASKEIKVTRQSYYVHLTPQQYVHHPQDTVKVGVKTLDANDDPVSVKGDVTIFRDYWETRYEKAEGPISQRKIVFEGYRNEKITSQSLKTNEKGEAQIEFKPEREGYYRVVWVSEDKDGVPVRSETAVFVCTKQSRDIGYRYGGIQIIPDKETYHAGETAKIMLVAPSSDSYAILSIDGDDIYSYELVHFDGMVKLIELPIEALHEPNVFLNAFMVRDAQMFIDHKEIIVPPVEKFLNVKLDHPKARYEPGEMAEISLSVTDHAGKPVRAELALGVVDESVYYIQQDYAGDIREFFYGRKRQPVLNTQSSFQIHPYIKGKWTEKQEQFEIDDAFARSDTANLRRRMAKDVAGFSGGREFDEMRSMNQGAKCEESIAVGGALPSSAAATRSEAKQDAPKRKSGLLQEKESADKSQNQGQAVTVRSDFRTTVLWEPTIKTDENGKAKVKIKYPDSLTAWKSTARAISAGSEIGMAETTTRTKKDLLVRLEMPRFLVEKDEVTISGIVHNDTGKPLSVEVSIKADGIKLLGETTRTIKVKPNEEVRVDWKAEAVQAGKAKLTLSAVSGKQSDAMEKVLPIYEHGVEKFTAQSGWSRPDQAKVSFSLDLPKARNSAGTSLEVILTPSIAVTCLDALPYLADYPYGCTEQTMSRFLPSAIVAKTLEDLGLDRSAVEKKLFGGIEKEFAGKTHPEGRKELRKLDEMIRDGLERLRDMQHSDGGWGWWKEGDSDHFMTAYVVQGLILAKQAGVSVPGGLIDRGMGYLSKEIVEEELNLDMQAWMAYALAAGSKHEGFNLDKNVRKQLDHLWENRQKLNAYSRALLALAFHFTGDPARAKTLIENLENGIRVDEAAQTVHWGEDGIYYCWSEGGVEATAWALKAMVAIDPQNKRIPQAMNWLVKNRRGAQWSNTRDTAMVLYALTDYLRQSKELGQSFEYELFVNGTSIAKQKITPKNALDARSRFNIPEKLLRDGGNEIRIEKTGKGTLYHAAHLKYFSREDPIPAAGNEIYVTREYFRYAGRPTLLKGYVYDRIPLKDGDQVQSGDRVEVKLTVESKNHYEYLVFEDLKPAGLEAVQIRSGEPMWAAELKAEKYRKAKEEEPTGRQSQVHQELRDRKIALFLSKLPEGIHTMTYDLRAESPGKFHALPCLGHAMYVPEIRCNSDEMRLTVIDAPAGR